MGDVAAICLLIAAWFVIAELGAVKTQLRRIADCCENAEKRNRT